MSINTATPKRGVGMPSKWRNVPTAPIRIPTKFHESLLTIAKQLDAGDGTEEEIKTDLLFNLQAKNNSLEDLLAIEQEHTSRLKGLLEVKNQQIQRLEKALETSEKRLADLGKKIASEPHTEPPDADPFDHPKLKGKSTKEIAAILGIPQPSVSHAHRVLKAIAKLK